mgnify:CR=1 FL=1
MTAIDIRPVGAALGAEIHGIDLNHLSDDEVEGIFQAFADHLVLFFPGQNLSPDGHREFAARFGELEVVPILQKLDEAHPEIVVLNDADTPAADVWHTDVTFSESPPITAILHMVDCPPVGGDTQWINLYQAYETLSAPLREMLDGMTAIHVNNYGSGQVAEHPVVRVHPETGRKSLYVNGAFTVGIKGMRRSESDALLGYLFRHAVRERFTCRVRWEPGTLTMWDNRSVQHYALHDYAGHSRHMRRITVKGDRPV